jgi:hypothetical protein
MQPLLLWQTGFWAAMHHCYVSGSPGDLVNMLHRLSLCLVMLALLPVAARCNRRARLKALAREAERAAKHVARDRDPQHVYFEACPDSGLPPQPDIPAYDAQGGESCPAQDNVQDSTHELACSPLPPNPAKLQTSSIILPVKRKHSTIEGMSATSADGPEPLSLAPFSNRDLTKAGPEAFTQLVPLDFGAAVGTQQGDNGTYNEHQGAPSTAEGETPDGTQHVKPPPGPPVEGGSGSLLLADQHWSSRELVDLPRTRSQQTCTVPPELPAMWDKSEVISGGSEALDCALVQPSQGQKVCTLTTRSPCKLEVSVVYDSELAA